MRRTLSAIVLVLLLAPDASAQPIAAGQLARTGAMQAEIAAQASFDTSYLLALYMTQLAAAGAPPSQADIDEAATQYLTNGAAVTGVPSTGPGAEYFRNGAAVTGVPSSGPGATYFHDGAAVMAYPTPRATPAPGATNQAVTGAVASESYEEDAGTSQAVANTVEGPETRPREAQPAPVSEVEVGSRTMGLTCSPLEIEAAIAIASQFATAAAPPRSAASRPPSTASNPVPLPVETAEVAETAPARVAEAAPECPAGPSPLARIATALAGAILGGVAVALWSRRRANAPWTSTQYRGRARRRTDSGGPTRTAHARGVAARSSGAGTPRRPVRRSMWIR